MNRSPTNPSPRSALRERGLPHHERIASRREFIARAGAGFGVLPTCWLLAQDQARAGQSAPGAGGAAAGPVPHLMGKAKRVIFLFMEGGPSHIDTFDPKPMVNQMAGKPVPESLRKGLITAMGEAGSPILASKRKWAQHGQSGLWVSDWFPNVARCADELCVVRSVWGNGINHAGGVCQMNTGSPVAGRPSLGSWVSYGLGTENHNLPAFVVLQDSNTQIVNGPRNWGAGFMPAVHQGIRLQNGPEPIPNLHPPQGLDAQGQRRKLDLLAELNRQHAALHPDNTELDARLRSYELAFRMQAQAPDAVDLASEPAHVRALYGLERKETATFGRMCLLARRLAERGVRFIQLYSGAGSKWDAHNNIEPNHTGLCLSVDQPIAGLLHDLRQRGLLEDTLVVWGGEFGRTPMSEKGGGRDHNPTGFTIWLAGAGVRAGTTVGATDEFGLHAVEDRTHVHDLHATLLRLMGLDHTRLVYFHKGRPERADQNEGHVNERILA